MLSKSKDFSATIHRSSMIPRCGLGLPTPLGLSNGGGRGAKLHIYIFKFFLFLILSGNLGEKVGAAPPSFYETFRLSALELAEDTEVNSIIYRLRAKDTDRDYPLRFTVDPIGSNIIYLNVHTCSRSNNIMCEADVYLGRAVEAGRVYTFDITVTDATGSRTTVRAKIIGNAGRVTPICDIFLKYSPAIRVKEDRPPMTVISTMIVKKRKGSPFGELHTLGDDSRRFKVVPGRLMSSETINVSIVLENKLDYDTSNLHLFQVCQLSMFLPLQDPYTKREADTRNIACVSVAVMVEDVQDLPPLFKLAPPVSRIPSVAVKGDEVAKVMAEDMDKGDPREIRYSILPASSHDIKSFEIDYKTGVITMSESAAIVREKMVSLDPILMTVTAEELTKERDEYPPLATSVEIAFVVLDAEILVPKFVHEKYVGEIFEDSAPDTAVIFEPAGEFLDMHVKGLFALEIDGDGGRFTVQPGVVKDSGHFDIKVKNPALIDFEIKPQIDFKLIARQVRGPHQVTGIAEITVRVIDTNDNKPEFAQNPYVTEIFENATRGTTIARVHATDKDTGPFGAIRYTTIYGPLSDRLYLDPSTGVVTVATDNHSFDREAASEYVLTVEARDNNGQGTQSNVASAKIIIRLLDVNDSPPEFQDSIYKGVLAPDLLRLREPIRVRATDKDAERPNNEIEYDIERSSYSEYFHIDRFTGYLDMKQNFAPLALPLRSGANKTTELVRHKRQLDDSDTVINLRVKATDRGYPPLSETVDVKIFKQEFGERVFKFIYPKPRDEVMRNRIQIEATLNDITGGTTEIKDVRQRRTGYLGTSIDPDRSEVTALVSFGVSTVVDLEKVLSNMNNTEVHQLRTEKQESEKVIKEIEGQNYSYLVGVVFLCLILMTVVIVIILCCFCEGCPLYKDRKKYSMVSDDGSEGVSYIRVDENGKYKRNLEGENPAWWEAMPRFLKNIFLMCGYVPNDRNSSRLAWSADERQRYWKMHQGPDDGLVGDRPSVMRHSRNPRDAVLLEDLDDSRFHRERLHKPGPYPRVESRTSQNSEIRRVFLLKNAKEIAARRGDSFRDGEMYLIEDVDENPPPMRVEDGRNGNIMVHQDDEYAHYTRQGNGELLRHHASPRDAAYFNGQMRRVRRAGVESEGAVLMEGDPGGGLSSRLIEGQSVGQTPRSHREYYMDDRRGYDHRYAHNTSPPQSDAYIQTDDGRSDHYVSRKRMKSPIQEETRSLLDAEKRSFRDKNRSRKSLRSDVQRSNEKVNEDYNVQRSKSSKSARSANIPGTHGYQHTKTSILRYESNKAKIEEDREELIRQGKDPDTCNHAGSISAGDLSSMNTLSRSASKLDIRRSHSQNTLAGSTVSEPERRGSLPEVETTIEKEAARRMLVRRNSAGGYERYEDMPVEYQEAVPHQAPLREQVIYVNEAEHAEEIERRREQRRTEASEALSEEFMRNTVDDGQMQVAQGTRAGPDGAVSRSEQLQVPNSLQPSVQHPGTSEITRVQNNNSINHNGRIGHLETNEVSNNSSHSPLQERQSNVDINQDINTNSLIGNSNRQLDPNISQPHDERSYANVNRSGEQLVSNIANLANHNASPQPQDTGQTTTHTHVSSTGNRPEVVSSLDKEGRRSNLVVTSHAEQNRAGVQDAPGSSRTAELAAQNLTSVSQEENNNTILRHVMESRELIDEHSNLPDDVKSAHSAYREQYETKEEAIRIMEEEMNLGMTKSSKIFEKNSRNDKSMLNIPNKKKRSRMLEKKSVFTIAYDGMKTDQLRPESATVEP